MKTAFFLIKNRRFDMPYSSVKTKYREECSICLSSLEENIVELDCCGHMYHEKCIRDSLRVSRLCPLCRRNVDNIENDCCVCF
jgi:hypothetical protein